MLPKIKKGVIDSLQRSSKDKSFIRDCWAEMMITDKELFDCITDTCEKIPTRQMKEGFLRGCWLVASLYKIQDEVDEMDENWGI